ncbi:MAG: hypothetical protein PHE49_00695 [bacterium]|nr:hypothetical protein [bacterium]
MISLFFFLILRNNTDTTEADSLFRLPYTITYIHESDIQWLPLSEFLFQQPGVIKSGNTLYFRGIATGEAGLFIVDGIDITDPVYKIPWIAFNEDAISKIWMTLDGVGLGYENTNLGILNISTMEGSNGYDGNIKYSTNSRMGEQFFNFNLGGSFPLLKKVTFFASGRIDTTDNHSPSILPKINNGLYQTNGILKLLWAPKPFLKIGIKNELLNQTYQVYDHYHSQGAWIEDWPVYKSKYYGLTFSLTHNISRNTNYTINAGRYNYSFKVSSQGEKSYNNWKEVGKWLPWVSFAYDSGWYNPKTNEWRTVNGVEWSAEKAWRYYYEKIAQMGYTDVGTGEWVWNSDVKATDIRDAYSTRYYQVNSYMVGKDKSLLTQNDSVVYEINDTTFVYFHKFDLSNYIEDVRKYMSDTTGTFSADSFEPSGNLSMIRYNQDEWGIFDYNFDPVWVDNKNATNFLNVSFNSQINKSNKLKIGTSLKQYEIDLTEVSFLNTNPYLYIYEAKPHFYTTYISDEFKNRKLLINAGARLDCSNSGIESYDYIDSRGSSVKKTSTEKYGIGPDLGISFTPFSSSVIYLNHKYFYRPQDFRVLAGYMQCADLEMEKTIMYSGGIRQKLPLKFILGVSPYYKETRNLLTTKTISDDFYRQTITYLTFAPNNKIETYGIDLQLEKNFSNWVSGTFGYSYLRAKLIGISAEDWFKDWFYTGGTQISPEEYALPIDRTHSYKANIHFSVPTITTFSPLSNWNLDFRYSYTSGALFDSTIIGVARLSPISKVDIRAEKEFNVVGLNLGLFMNVWNVFNIKNILKVYSSSGKPDSPIINISPYDSFYYEGLYENYKTHCEAYKEMYGYTSGKDIYNKRAELCKSYYNNPDHYDTQRIIEFGIVTHF